ncbi:MAG: hypothetical protein GY799_21385 [Desulfobulbaceae bacterium]|nr:hypothetical protein [Desulfobulbaceae bacterium]
MTKRIVHEMDFKKDGAHVALVTKGANQQSVLLMKKSNEVRVNTSMHTFLKRFFGMMHDDAGELTHMMGMEPQDWYHERLGPDTEVHMLKSLDDESFISSDLYAKLEKMESDFKQLEKGRQMKDEKTTVTMDLQKSIDAAVNAALAKQAGETAELKKTLEDKETILADLQKAEDTRIKGEFVELCKGYSFVEDADTLAVALFKCKDVEGFDLITGTLEKARKAIKDELEGEVGTDEEVELNKSEEVPDNMSQTAKLIKARYNKETK